MTNSTVDDAVYDCNDENEDDDFDVDDEDEDDEEDDGGDKFEVHDDSFKFDLRSPTLSSSVVNAKVANPYAGRFTGGGGGDHMTYTAGGASTCTAVVAPAITSNEQFILSDEEFDRVYCKPPTASSSYNNNRNTPAAETLNRSSILRPQYNAGGDHRPSTYRIRSHATPSISNADEEESPLSLRHSLNFFKKSKTPRRSAASPSCALTRLMLCYYPPTFYVERTVNSAIDDAEDGSVSHWRRLRLNGIRPGMSRDEINYQLRQHNNNNKQNRAVMQRLPADVVNSACNALALQYAADLQVAPMRWFSAWATKCDNYSDINSLDVSKDGRFFLVALDSRQVHVMSTNPAESASGASGGPEQQIFDEHKADVRKAVFNQPWCNEVVSICADGYLRIFDIETGITKNSIQAHQREATAMSVSHHRPSGSAYIATGGMDNRLHIFDSRSNFAVFKTDKHHTLPIRAVEWDDRGRRLVTSGDDGLAFVWDIRKNDQPVGILEGHTNAVTRASIDCSSRFVITGSEDRTVKLWNINTANPQCVFTSRCHSDDITDIKFTADGSSFASSSRDGTACVYTTTSAALERPTPCKAASSTEMFSAMLLNNMQPNHLIHKLAGPVGSGEMWSIAFNNAGTQLAAAHNDGKVRVYNVRQGCMQQEMLGFKAEGTHVQYSYDGALLIAAGKDRNIKGWTRKYD